jgi:pantoate--beta-alanine ligase
MKLIRSARQAHSFVRALHRGGKSVGFVPTMGALHEGHLSLFRKARSENDALVVSVFVNPAQFGPHEDYRRYPRPLGRDIKLSEREKVNILFVPSVREMYPEGFQTFVEPGPLAEPLCGKLRPGHFRGVATIVAKLFHIVAPDRAYFGAKDYQQALVVRQMARDLDLPVQICICPIVRDPDGLALSSRNAYLGPKDRAKALSLSRALRWARGKVKSGLRDASRLRKGIREILKAEVSRIDYIEVCDATNLLPVKQLSGKICIALAAFVNAVRLIDNCFITIKRGRARK